ncbi:cytochrome P450 [Catenulispora pinisilvae]|uniref:cytochrome P450 n=1 Tax=Catenulispora pinisilvae TaxID=2705253 RepID=UPI001890C3CC|nr:cytochrome P450 [Catenulispora pinisilvae]
MSAIPEIDLADPAVLSDPFTVYGRAREQSPVARLLKPGLGAMWALTRYEDAKAMLTDVRFEMNANSYVRPDVPELQQQENIQQMDGPKHARLRRLLSTPFTARRAAEFRPALQRTVESLLDGLAGHADGEPVDLLGQFSRPFAVHVACELVGIVPEDYDTWRTHAAAVAVGHGPEFMQAVPGIARAATEAVARSRRERALGLLAELLGTDAEDQDQLTDTELITVVWHLVLAGQGPAYLIANSVEVLLQHPVQLAELRADESLMPGAVEELTRMHGPQVLTLPRYAREDVEIAGMTIPRGDRICAVLASANRDPRVFEDPDRLDFRRVPGRPAHLGYVHGSHFCLGAALARVQTGVALSMLLRRFPKLALAGGDVLRIPNSEFWRPTALLVTL